MPTYDQVCVRCMGDCYDDEGYSSCCGVAFDSPDQLRFRPNDPSQLGANFHGVYRIKSVRSSRGMRYRAQMRFCGKTFSIFECDKPLEAARCYDNAAFYINQKFPGTKVRQLNFPHVYEDTKSAPAPYLCTQRLLRRIRIMSERGTLKLPPDPVEAAFNGGDFR